MEKFNKLQFVSELLIGVGVNQIVDGFIANNTNPKNVMAKASLKFTGFVLSTHVSDQLSTSFHKKVRRIVDEYKKIRQDLENS